MRKFLAIFLCLAMHAQAALTFAAGSTNTVNCGSSATMDAAFNSAGTILMWLFPTNIASQNVTWISKCQSDSCGTVNNFYNSGITVVQFSITRATTNLFTRANLSALPTLAINTWAYMAVTYDPAGSAGNQQLWGGNLTTPVAEATSYTSQTAGTGAITDTTAGNLMIGGRPSINVAMVGRIALVHIVNRRLSLGELQAQQFAPHAVSGTVLFVHLGFNGTGTQADWSGGGNNCTVTGATQSADAPIAPFSAFLRRVFPMLPAWWRL